MINKRLFIYCIAAATWGSSSKAQAQDSVYTAPDTLPALHSVVNIAYGQTNRHRITYSAHQVNGQDLINNTVYATGNALYGKLPGLTVVSKSGEPGADAPDLFLRGRSTTNSNTPLIMVDGIERDVNDVPVEDIQSITVLKDAAACVIYGLRGANGVILVTTRRGKEAKLSIRGSVDQAVVSPVRIPKFVSSADYVQLYNQALANDGLTQRYTQDQIAGYQKGHSIFYPNVDWQREVVAEHTDATRANINISGGDKTARYFVSLGYFRQGGIYKNTDQNDGYSTNINLNNFSFRSNLDVNLNKNWTVGLDLAGRIYEKNAPVSTTASIWDAMYKYPAHLFPVYVQDNLYGGTAFYPNNPVGYVHARGYRQTNNRLIQTSLFSRYNLDGVVKGLSAGLKYSTDNYYRNEEGYSKAFAVAEIIGQSGDGKPIISPLIGNNTNLATLSSNGYPLNDLQNKRNTFEGDMSYIRGLGVDHDINTQLIYHQDRLIIDSESSYNFQFLAGRFNYGFRNRYFVELGASVSGTEAFPKDDRYGIFPAASVAWVLSEEDFLKQSTVFNFLKLRASAGKLGNADLGERFSDRWQYLSGTGYYFGSAHASDAGLSAGTVPNPFFTWETSQKLDAGADARLWNLVDVSLTGFLEKRKDILIAESSVVPSIIGAPLPKVNAAEVENRGFEAVIGVRTQKGDRGFHSTLNIGYASNKILSIPEPQRPESYLYKTGQQINQPQILEAIGFFESYDDIANSPVQQFGNVAPGDIKYKDQNKDNLINELDYVPIHNTKIPKWDMGLDLGGRYRNFEIGVLLHAQLGRSIYLGDEPLLFWPLMDNGSRITTFANQFWTEQSKATADYPRLTTMENPNNYRPSSFWYVNGNFLRVRAVNIVYHLPKQWANHIRLQHAGVYLRATNLITWDHLQYTDPEVLSGYPLMKSYNMGIRLQF
jgi:TonB-linked outer membrane protein, SusC/RagA family